jgi:hypothetical protein
MTFTGQPGTNSDYTYASGERGELVDKLANDPAIEKFLVDVETRSLQAYRSKDSEVCALSRNKKSC